MIVRKDLDPKIVFKVAWKRVSLLFLISVAVTIAYNYFQLDVAIDNVPASILGIALAIMVGFRINSAYERWWEARRLWGAIVNDSRSIGRQCLTFFSTNVSGNTSPDEIYYEKRKFIYRQIAFVNALKNHLRKQNKPEELKAFLPEAEYARLANEQNIPNTILLFHAEHLQNLLQNDAIEDFRHMQIDTRISALCDSMGGCERIKNTVFPRQYSYYARFFIALYSYLLPFVFVDESTWATIPFTIVIGFIFFALDSIARGIENPFENGYNDTPMSSICRTIEINLKQMLAENEVPETLQPVNGFLY